MGLPQDTAKGLDLFKSLVFDPVVEALIVAYEGPVITTPFIGIFVKDLEVSFANRLYDALGQQVILGTVLFVNLEHRKAFDTASTKLQQVAIQYGVNSQQFKDEHAKEREALKKFGQFNIAQPGLLGH